MNALRFTECDVTVAVRAAARAAARGSARQAARPKGGAKLSVAGRRLQPRYGDQTRKSASLWDG